MTQKERAQALADRILDHLTAEGFHDDQVYARAVVTYDNKVLVRLYPHQFGCAPCADKGLVAKFTDSVKLMFGAQWCPACRKAADQYVVRSRELMPHLKVLLERMFGAQESTPDYPGSFLITTS